MNVILTATFGLIGATIVSLAAGWLFSFAGTFEVFHSNPALPAIR